MKKSVLLLAIVLLCHDAVITASTKVAVLRSWGDVTTFAELNNNWSSYGTTPLEVDTSLMASSNFTYTDLAQIGADVLWISDAAGGSEQYSADEIAAVQQYANEGHAVLGTYVTFQFGNTDNRGLAPIFGLREDISYNTTEVSADQTFDILTNHPIFNGISDPYNSDGYPNAQVPADDLTWDESDLMGAQLLAQTLDNRGIITWYETSAYHAIYISEMVEYNGNAMDAQFLYNALTVPEPCSLVLLSLGGLMLRRKSKS